MATELYRIKLRLKKLTGILGGLLFFLPLVLMFIDGTIRPSISDYAYMVHSEWFVSMVSIAGTVFIMDGSFWNKRWYNIILGCSLIGVSLTPHLFSPFVSTIHYIFAAIFFVGSIIVMVIFSSAKQRLKKILMALVILGALFLHFVFNLFSLFWAEWIGMLPIVIHFLGEAFEKLD